MRDDVVAVRVVDCGEDDGACVDAAVEEDVEWIDSKGGIICIEL
jgi:hypothetical protein